MKQVIIGIAIGVLLASLLNSGDAGLSDHLAWSILGIAIVSAITGERKSLWLRLAVTIVSSWWVLWFMVLHSHAIFDPYKTLTFDEYLQMPWGSAWNQSLERAKQDERTIRMHRGAFEQYAGNLAKRQRQTRDHVLNMSAFRVSAAYANRWSALLADAMGRVAQGKISGVSAWVHEPPSKWDRLANSDYSLPLLRNRLLGYLCLGGILISFLVLQRIFRSRSEDNQYETVIELCIGIRGLEIVSFLLLALIVAAILPLATVYMGHYSEILPFLYFPLFGVILWYSVFHRREIC